MATTTRLTLEEFRNLPDNEGERYELDEGELLMTPSPTVSHNRVRDRIFLDLKKFTEDRQLGEILLEMDFQLTPDTVRRPDLAFVTTEHLQRTDVERWPVIGAPAIAIEVISPSNRAQDIAKMIGQYINSGSRSVWVVYPNLRYVEIHSASGVRKIQAPAVLADESVIPGFSMQLSSIFQRKD